jgi:hypothetical protein
MRALLVLVIGLAFVGCAPLYPAQIAPEGNGVYLITQSSASAWLDARSSALKRAAAFCEDQHKQIQVVTTGQERVAGQVQSADHAAIEFRCE